jgi:hypothetical protein
MQQAAAATAAWTNSPTGPHISKLAGQGRQVLVQQQQQQLKQ